jgi:hypothetical protein
MKTQGSLRPRSVFLSSLLFFAPLALVSACGGSKQAVEQPPSLKQSTAQATPATTEEPPAAPQLSEVEAAVKRIFNDAAVVHPAHKTSFLAGDFNGDLSQDLAVVLKPVPEKLTEMNESPRWLLRDPRAPYNPAAPLRVEKDEPLLAVIHGYGSKAWRDPEATQTFLLKNIVGTDLRVQDGKEFVKARSGQKIPRTHGDVIGEKLKGSEGYLYFNAANYSWYDPKTFKDAGDTTAGVFHGRSARR